MKSRQISELKTRKTIQEIGLEIEAISETLLALPVTEKAERLESAIIQRIKFLQSRLEQIYKVYDFRRYQNWIK